MEIKKLTPAEITNLWNSYISNTMAEGVTRYLIEKMQDQELRSIFEYALEIAVIEVRKAKEFLEGANHPLPQNFDQTDFNMGAPALYTDNFALLIKIHLAMIANLGYSLCFNTSTRSDIRDFYQECMKNSSELTRRLADLLVKKGLHHPQLYIPTPDHAELVSKQTFLAGWFADRRPINAAEIAQLEYNFKCTEFQRTLLKGFAQVSQTQQIKDHFKRGVTIYEKHLDYFQTILTENGLPQLPTWESEINYDSTIPPFSDRMMLFKIGLLAGATAARYGTSLSTVQRRDLGANFPRLIAEVLSFGEDTLNIMIEHGYLVQLPIANIREGSL